MVRITAIIGIAGALIVIAFVLEIARSVGIFRTLVPRGNTECRLIKGAVGAEDITVYQGIAFVSSDDRLKVMPIRDGKTKEQMFETLSHADQGHIYILDLEAHDPVFVELPLNDAPLYPDFHPHGLNLLTNGGKPMLFVVSHTRTGDQVLVFDIVFEHATSTRIPTALKWRYTVFDKLFLNTNDLVAIDEGQFYITTWTYSDPGSWMGYFELFTRREWAYVTHCIVADPRAVGKKMTSEKVTCRKMLHLSYPNGINISPDGKFIYVAVIGQSTFNVYNRDAETGDLSLNTIVPVSTALDNIEVDPQSGKVWAGAHPQTYKFIRHANSLAKERAPSQVLEFTPPRSGTAGNKEWKVTELFVSHGDDLPGSSVGTVIRSQGRRLLVIGSVFADGVLLCIL